MNCQCSSTSAIFVKEVIQQNSFIRWYYSSAVFAACFIAPKLLKLLLYGEN